ncbi:MAG: ribonuclease Z [Candidatus Methylarchaceae archaeon HK01M]|nr:ribonuclease Z [Candidatus Methylarchaceae archaeon HK01M]
MSDLKEANDLVQLRLIFLGTSSSIPTPGRSLTSLALMRGKEILLFDVGEGTQRQMIKIGIGFGRITNIFITHFHGDHILGLLGLLQTMSLLNRDRPLNIYGPRGIIGFLRNNMRYLKFGLTFQISVHEVKGGVIMKEKDYVVEACPSEHSVRSYSYLLKEFDRQGVFYPEKASKLGVPKGKLWSTLQRGENVTIGDKIINPDQVLGKKRPGRKIGISGDTRPSPLLSKLFSNADVIVFDSTYGEEYLDKAKENMHSTCVEAAQLAKDAEAKLLVLTHFSARYSDVSKLVFQALKIHPNVVAASDLEVIEVPYPDERV